MLFFIYFCSRTPQGCVDWNSLTQSRQNNMYCVAPLKGAWIEMLFMDSPAISNTMSHPTKVRELKSIYVTLFGISIGRAHTGSWIEILISYFFRFCKSMSHPTWVRGLKFKSLIPRNLSNCSHPTRVRDLKSMLRFLAHTLSENRTLHGCDCGLKCKNISKRNR